MKRRRRRKWSPRSSWVANVDTREETPQLSVSHSLDRGTLQCLIIEQFALSVKSRQEKQPLNNLFCGPADNFFFRDNWTSNMVRSGALPTGKIFLKLSGQMQENKQASNYEGNSSHAQLPTRTAGLVHYFTLRNTTQLKGKFLEIKDAGAGLGILWRCRAHDNIHRNKYLR